MDSSEDTEIHPLHANEWAQERNPPFSFFCMTLEDTKMSWLSCQQPTKGHCKRLTVTGESCPNAHTVWHGISAFPCKFRRLLQLLVEKINADCSLEDFKKRKKFLFELSHSVLRLCFCIVSDGNKARFHLCVKLQTYNFCVENTPEPRAVTKANCETVGKKKRVNTIYYSHIALHVSLIKLRA